MFDQHSRQYLSSTNIERKTVRNTSIALITLIAVLGHKEQNNKEKKNNQHNVKYVRQPKITSGFKSHVRRIYTNANKKIRFTRSYTSISMERSKQHKLFIDLNKTIQFSRRHKMLHQIHHGLKIQDSLV